MTRSIWIASLSMALWCAAAQAETANTADNEEQSVRDNIVRRNNRGLKLSLSPGVMIPVDGGPAAFSIGLQTTYGFDLPVVMLLPGLEGEYVTSTEGMILAMGTLRVVFPLGFFGPYLQGGIGYGHLGGTPSTDALALSVGAGFMLYLSRLSLGVTAGYHTLVGTGSSWISIGPVLAF